MSKFPVIIVAALGVVFAGLALVAARQVPKVRPNTYVGSVAVGGMQTEEAGKALTAWWDAQKNVKLHLHAAGLRSPLPDETPDQLGITLDVQGIVSKLPTDDLASQIGNVVGQDTPAKQSIALQFKCEASGLKPLGLAVEKLQSKPHPAKVFMGKVGIVAIPEVPGSVLDLDATPAVLTTALATGETGAELPMKQGPKHVPDEELKKITDVVSQFSTRFSAGNRPRASNIRLASSKLRGVVLMPGDRLSFNGTVGRRTLKGGFKLAGVYKNGKHDVGVGGGICQVSTTLYNACLLGDLKIRQRSNHSLPVPYVPLGRDATVDYGSLDLIVENSNPNPIAVESYYEPGRLTFRILGTKDPTLKVKIRQEDAETWDGGVKTVIDRNLPPGRHRVIEPGSAGHAVTTYRFVYRDGKLVRKDRLGRSTYGGHTRIMAYNPAPKITAPPTLPAQPTPQPTAVGQTAG